ncbi:MAG: hypothetical protein LH474_07765, partial [Chamaesiphon sp.]|nr:hypothetical protein [Chamaesiphon sp.]
MLTTFRTTLQDKLGTLSFKTKALSAVVFLSLLPVVGVGGLAYIVSLNNLQNTEKDGQQLITSSFSDAVTRFISIRTKDAATMGLSPIFNNSASAKVLNRQDKEKFLNDYLDRYAFYNG